METTFTLGESSEDVLENVCFIVLSLERALMIFFFCKFP